MTLRSGRRRLRGFAPVARADARVLVLGSMPGGASLAAGRYYAHPRNAFWPIFADLLHWPADADYAARTRALTAAGIALWDVVRECHREGSLDADIDAGSIRINDFAGFFRTHPHIACIACNGGAAERLFRSRVLPVLRTRPWPTVGVEPVLLRLPSTSPAHAARDFAGKRAAWRAALAPYLAAAAR
jgi:TDG/mug DNA glycosylase family protein